MSGSSPPGLVQKQPSITYLCFREAVGWWGRQDHSSSKSWLCCFLVIWSLKCFSVVLLNANAFLKLHYLFTLSVCLSLCVGQWTAGGSWFSPFTIWDQIKFRSLNLSTNAFLCQTTLLEKLSILSIPGKERWQKSLSCSTYEDGVTHEVFLLLYMLGDVCMQGCTTPLWRSMEDVCCPFPLLSALFSQYRVSYWTGS